MMRSEILSLRLAAAGWLALGGIVGHACASAIPVGNPNFTVGATITDGNPGDTWNGLSNGAPLPVGYTYAIDSRFNNYVQPTTSGQTQYWSPSNKVVLGNTAIGSWNSTLTSYIFNDPSAFNPGQDPLGLGGLLFTGPLAYSTVATFTQTLATTFAANTTYILTADVSLRNGLSLGDVQLNLLDNGTPVSGEVANFTPPTAGNTSVYTLTFTTGASGGPIGDPIGIQLQDSATGSGIYQALFNGVALNTPSPTPEPASMVLVGLGLGGLALLRARRRA